MSIDRIRIGQVRVMKSKKKPLCVRQSTNSLLREVTFESSSISMSGTKRPTRRRKKELREPRNA